MNLDLNRRFLERAASNKAERLDKHRFLVQAKEISDEEYARVVAIAPAQRSEEVSIYLHFYVFSCDSKIPLRFFTLYFAGEAHDLILNFSRGVTV